MGVALHAARVSSLSDGSADVGSTPGGTGVPGEAIVLQGVLDLVLCHAASEGGYAEGEVSCGGAAQVLG